MRVTSNKSIHLLKNLGLDPSLFRLAKDLIHLNERLEKLQQDLTFLCRCKEHGITPNCIRRCVNICVDIKRSKSLERVVEYTRKQLLTLLIRTKHGLIQSTTDLIDQTRSKIPEDIQQLLMPAILVAKRATRYVTKRKQKAKLAQLLTKQPDSNQLKLQPTATAEDRVSILGNIPVSKTAIEALAKGPNFALTSRLSAQELQRTVQVEIAALAYNMRWHYTNEPRRLPSFHQPHLTYI